jgi:hypothetical protein
MKEAAYHLVEVTAVFGPREEDFLLFSENSR